MSNCGDCSSIVVCSSLGEHEQRVALLDDIAISAGYWSKLAQTFPDGTRPDVLRHHPGTHALFVGDAKESERPTNSATQARLLSYLCVMANPIVFKHGSVFAICFGRGADFMQWQSVVQRLAQRAKLNPIAVRSDELDSDDYVVSLLL